MSKQDQAAYGRMNTTTKGKTMTTLRILQRNAEPVTYKGKTVQSIIRRVYGAKAAYRPSQDANSPTWGLVVKPGNSGGWDVIATVIDFDGVEEDVA